MSVLLNFREFLEKNMCSIDENEITESKSVTKNQEKSSMTKVIMRANQLARRQQILKKQLHRTTSIDEKLKIIGAMNHVSSTLAHITIGLLVRDSSLI